MAKRIIRMPPLEILVAEVNKILARYKKETLLTLRQLFYQLVARHIIVNDDKAYKRLSAMLVKAREQRLIDDSRIEDRNRETIGGDYEKRDPEKFFHDRVYEFKNCWKQYSRPMWQDQPRYVEVWIEKDALSRLVSDIADQYGVTTCVCKGYSSYTFLKDAAIRINACCSDGDKEPVIILLTDFDPSGMDMLRDLGVRLERYGVLGATKIVHRVALTPEQIAKCELPPDLTKDKDARAKKFIEEYGNECVELDALDPEVLQEIVRSSIEKCINVHIWNENAKKSNEEVMMIREQVEEYFRGRT